MMMWWSRYLEGVVAPVLLPLLYQAQATRPAVGGAATDWAAKLLAQQQRRQQ
jgi:hypothetical protein